MSVILSALWSYAGLSMREREAGWADANRCRFLAERKWGYLAPLIVDGRTEVNRENMDALARNARANGLPVVGWATPRPTAGVPISETVAMVAEAVRRYGLAGVRYQCEAEFEYSNPATGGTPAERFASMEVLGIEHRAQLGTLPAAVYARVALGLADAWWAMAWRYQMRCFIENYGPAEGGTHPGWATVSAPSSALPPLVGGWWYRVRLGTMVYLGRLSDDARTVTVEGQGIFKIGSPTGPRHIAAGGNNKWGAVLGFFPTSWLKIVVPSYAGAIGHKPAGATLAGEIRTFQSLVRKFGGATKGYSVYVGPEMNDDHYASISPSVLTGAALTP